MRIHVVFLGNSFGPWSKLYQEGALKTWCNPATSRIESNIYIGNRPTVVTWNMFINRLLVSRLFRNRWKIFVSSRTVSQIKIRDKDSLIILDLPELWCNITLKTIASLKYVRDKHNFDFIIRANASCYVNIKSLTNYLGKLKDSLIYAGPVMDGKKFVSGWGIVMSKPALDKLLSSFNFTDFELFDDEAIGRIMKRNRVRPIKLSYLELNSAKQIDLLTEEQLMTTVFFRMKSFEENKRMDHVLMNLLHKRIIGINSL